LTTLTPLVELATQKSLDLFFRLGRGYVARTARETAQLAAGFGLTPLGVQARAEVRIVAVLGHPAPDQQLYAWPCNEPRRQPLR
jgi:hypothetical protein